MKIDFKNNKKIINVALTLAFLIFIIFEVLNFTNCFGYNSMLEPRSCFTATLLKDGTVLIAGGYHGFDDLNSAEIYNPQTHHSHHTGSMKIKRHNHQAILMNDGRVLIIGGSNLLISDIKQVEIYDPKTRSFKLTDNLKIDGLQDFSLTKLKDGKILFSGGGGKYNGIRRSNEIYDPKTNSFKLVAFSNIDHSTHTANLLKNGNVLIIGGGFDYKTKETIDKQTEIYHLAINKFTIGPNLQKPRRRHCSITLNNGKVLVLGGNGQGYGFFKTAEIYDPKLNIFEPAGEMEKVRTEFGAVLLPNGNVYIIGGDDPDYYKMVKHPSCEIYNPKTNKFSKTKTCMKSLKYDVIPILLSNERLLLIGGGRPLISDHERKKIEIIDTNKITY